MPTSTLPKRQRVPQLLMWGLGIFILGTISCEIALRTLWGLGTPILVQPDPACGYILQPSQDVIRFHVHTYINRHSMRSDEIKPLKQQGTIRIVFLGDSITYGTTQVDQSQIFTEILHRELPSRLGHPVEVLNAAVSAWAPSNELDFIKSRGTFDADLLIWVWNSADLMQPRATLDQLGDKLASRKPSTALGELFQRYIFIKLFRLAARSDAGTSSGPVDTFAKRQNLGALSEMLDLLRPRHIPLVIMYIPTGKDIKTNALPSEIADWATKEHVGITDVSPYLAGKEPKALVLPDGAHYNGAGHRLIADSAESSIQSLRL